MAKTKTRYKVPCNVSLYADQITRLKTLKRHTDVVRNDVLRVALDGLLKKLPNDKELATYIKGQIDGERDI